MAVNNYLHTTNRAKTEKTNYEYNHKSTKTPKESSSGVKGSSYVGTPTGQISKRKVQKLLQSIRHLLKKLKTS